jgi:ketosteroid isomerase-like protein
MQRSIIALTLLGCVATSATAAEFNVNAAHDEFTNAFNSREWDVLKAMLAEDIVFHRANATEVYAGPDAVVGRFQDTIGAPDQWNVKFAILESSDQFSGNDGRVVERGDFAVTAGPDDQSCYRGSYIMTWAPQADDSWRLQMLTWQDVETELANCSR